MRTLSNNTARTYLAMFLLGLVSLGTLALSASPAVALDDTQQAKLDQAKNYLKNANADLDSARGSAGTAAKPATGSRLRLTKMRLSSATQRLGQAGESLKDLPADDDAVGAVQKDYDKVAAGIAEVNAIINPPAGDKEEAPAESDDEPSDSGEAAAPAKDVPKLHYTQEEVLKNAKWYLRETNAYADKAAAVVARMDAEGSKPVHREVRDALKLIETGKEKHTLAVEYIDQLPADHPKVKPTFDGIKQAGDKLGALESRLKAEDSTLAKLTGMEHYPNFEKDYTLLNDLGRRYYDFQQTMQQPEKLAKVVAEDGQVLAVVQRIAKTYLPLVEQKTEQGGRIENRFNHFQTQRNKFATELIAYKQTLPALFEADLKEASDLADEGVAKKNSMYFGENSGIAQRFGWAEQKLLVMRAFGEEEAKPYVERLEEVREQIKQRAKSLEAEIIANNTMPIDNYTGEDRDEIVAMAIDGWRVQQPDAEVLIARIPGKAWARETRWEWFNGSFYKVDKSTLQVQLIVKHDDKLAVKRPLNVRKDHLKGDTLIAVPLDSFEDELIPQRYILLEKVK